MTATSTQSTKKEHQPRIPRMPVRLTILQLAGIPLVVVVFSAFPVVTFLGLLGLGAVVLFVNRADRFWLRLFILAAFYGTLGEAFCVYGTWFSSGRGFWIYNFPQIGGLDFRIPIWLPLVWGNLFVLFVSLASYVHVSIAPVEGARFGEFVRYLIAAALLAYAGTMYRIVDLHILYLFTPFFAAFMLYWNRLRDFVIFTVASVLGTSGEILAMREGLWIYTRPVLKAEWVSRLGVDGIPLSLSMAWGLSAVFLYHVARRKTSWRES